MKHAVYPEAYKNMVPLGLNMNVACALVKGIVKEIVYHIFDMGIGRLDLTHGLKTRILFQISYVYRWLGKLGLRGYNGGLEPEKLADDL